MGKRTYLKFVNNCKVTKVIKKGQKPKIFLKCYGKPKTRQMSAQDIINSLK